MACPIYNGSFKRFVLWIKNKLITFLSFKICRFKLWILTNKQQWRILSEMTLVKLENYIIFISFVQTKVYKVPLWIGYEGMRVWGYEDMRVWGYEGTWVWWYEGMRVWGYEGMTLFNCHLKSQQIKFNICSMQKMV